VPRALSCGLLFRLRAYLIQCPIRDQRISVMNGNGRSESSAL
jgi:hypothetical protein